MLDSLFSPANLELPGWEAIVVMDQGEADGSPEVCREFERRFKDRFRLLVQSRKGKSQALNHAIAHACGDILALTDDDVICAPDYIRGIQDVFTRYEVTGAQGRILLDCEGGLPPWVFAGAAKFMSLCDNGDEAREWNHTLFGTNMMVRAQAARTLGGFSPELGPGASGYAEDTEFSLRLLKAGHRFIYAPQVTVRHQIRRSRMAKPFFRRRYFGLGRSHAYYVPMKTAVWRFGLYAAKGLLLSQAEALWLRGSGNPAKAFECECTALEQAGFFWQHWRFGAAVRRQSSQLSSCGPPSAPA